MLLTVTGRKTGRQLTVPLLYLRDGERVIVVASKGGMDQHPLWYLNLVANPEVVAEIGTEERRMRAHTADESERAQLGPISSRCIAATTTTRRAPSARSRSSCCRRPEAHAPPRLRRVHTTSSVVATTMRPAQRPSQSPTTPARARSEKRA